MKRRLIFIFIMILACLLCVAAVNAEGIRGYSEQDKYCYIQLGTYPTTAEGERAPVLWRVLDVTDEQALLLSDKILDVQQVIFCTDREESDKRKFRKISDYSESDLNVWMNETMLADLCSEEDFSAALVTGKYGRLYPLTDEQFLNPDYGFDKTRWITDDKCLPCRQFGGTDYAKNHVLIEGFTSKANSKLFVKKRWGSSDAWIAVVKDPDDYKLGLLGFNGHLSYGIYTRINVGVLPAMTLDLNKCAVTGGNGTKEDPFLLAVQ